MSVSKGTIVRTIMLFVVMVNMLLKHFGVDVIDVSESEILTFVESFIEVAIIVVGFWKNNSYTDNAIRADEFLKKLQESEE